MEAAWVIQTEWVFVKSYCYWRAALWCCWPSADTPPHPNKWRWLQHTASGAADTSPRTTLKQIQVKKKYLFNNQPSLIAKVLECRSCSVWITCEGLPAVLSLSFSDLFPAAIISLSAAILLLFLSDRDDLWHWDTVTDTWTTHRCTQSS